MPARWLTPGSKRSSTPAGRPGFVVVDLDHDLVVDGAGAHHDAVARAERVVDERPQRADGEVRRRHGPQARCHVDLDPAVDPGAGVGADGVLGEDRGDDLGQRAGRGEP